MFKYLFLFLSSYFYHKIQFLAPGVYIHFDIITDWSTEIKLQGVRLAQKFEALVLADHRFEIPAARHLGKSINLLIFHPKYTHMYTHRAGV